MEGIFAMKACCEVVTKPGFLRVRGGGMDAVFIIVREVKIAYPVVLDQIKLK